MSEEEELLEDMENLSRVLKTDKIKTIVEYAVWLKKKLESAEKRLQEVPEALPVGAEEQAKPTREAELVEAFPAKKELVKSILEGMMEPEHKGPCEQAEKGTWMRNRLCQCRRRELNAALAALEDKDV